MRAVQSIRELFNPAGSGMQAKRVRTLDVAIAGKDGEPATSVRIDPASVRITPDPNGTSLLVAAPAEAFVLIDRLLETIDQSPAKGRLTIRRYGLEHARAEELTGTFQQLFDGQRQGPTNWEYPRAEFVADNRTNSLLVTATSGQHEEVQRLLASAHANAQVAHARWN